MMQDSPNCKGYLAGSSQEPFDTTHWSVVLAAGKAGSPRASQALAELCQEYWYPLYAYARRRVRDVNEAQDLTQEFFARLLEKNYLAAADPARGRFRAFLLTAFKHFLANEWKKARAQKRGGGRGLLSLDFPAGEQRLSSEPTHQLSPERLFDREWAVTLINRVLAQLRQQMEAEGKSSIFDQLKGLLAGSEPGRDYSRVAAALRTTEGAARVAVHRLRRRYGEILRREIAQTVSHPDEINAEIRSLFVAMSD